MKIGLITDLHEAVAATAAALDELRRRGVDEIICLGDFCEMGTELEETCALLLKHRVRCVWGNHDFGLCMDAREGKTQRYSSRVAEFAMAAQPMIRIDDLLFMHGEPWLNPNELIDLWFFDGLPDTPQKRERIFSQSDWSVSFMGHLHLWLAVNESQILPWTGKTTLDLSSGRHCIIVDAILNNQCAIFDTESRSLTPISLT